MPNMQDPEFENLSPEEEQALIDLADALASQPSEEWDLDQEESAA